MPQKAILPNSTSRPPVILAILDGWGIASEGRFNALTEAKTPALTALWESSAHTKLYAHGLHVGLPKDQVGNSEAGHLNIGAGRVVKQDAVYISNAIVDGTFFKNPAFLSAIQHAQKFNSRLHIMGIFSGEQCPHMSPEHLVALRTFTSKYTVRVLWHFFTDGRDSPPYAARDLWAQFKSSILGKNSYVATLSGRLYLDRKKQWSRTEKLYNALVLGRAEFQCKDMDTAISEAYKRGESDEFIEPTIIRNKEVGDGDVISDNDAIIFYNLRSDRARQLTKPFVQDQFEQLNQGAFKRAKVLRNTLFVAMTDFGPDLGPVLTAFPSRDVSNTLPMVLGSFYKQVYVAETEKYAHITYFLNGGYTAPIAGEDRILISSKKVKSYDQTPEMSCEEITDIALKALTRKWYNFVGLNYANADMLGHTGNIQAAIIGCAFVDKQIARLVKFIKKSNGMLIITADHGNAEYMGHQDEEVDHLIIDTMHETNPVPFIVVSKKNIKLKGQDDEEPGGKLGDVAPTLLDLAGIEKPVEMTGESLVVCSL